MCSVKLLNLASLKVVGSCLGACLCKLCCLNFLSIYRANRFFLNKGEWFGVSNLYWVTRTLGEPTTLCVNYGNLVASRLYRGASKVFWWVVVGGCMIEDRRLFTCLSRSVPYPPLSGFVVVVV